MAADTIVAVGAARSATASSPDTAPRPATTLRDGIPQSRAQQASRSPDRAMKAAREFEAVMLSQAFESMFKGVEAGGLTGGGHAEKTWRSFMLQEYGRAVSEAGGIGIAERVYEDIMRMQGTEIPADRKSTRLNSSH